jgi:hypothetical protein
MDLGQWPGLRCAQLGNNDKGFPMRPWEDKPQAPTEPECSSVSLQQGALANGPGARPFHTLSDTSSALRQGPSATVGPSNSSVQPNCRIPGPFTTLLQTLGDQRQIT